MDRIKKLILFGSIGALIGSCAIQKRKIVRVSSEQAEQLAYMKEKDISLDELKEYDSENNTGCCSIEEMKILALVRSKKITEKALNALSLESSTMCNDRCCDTLLFCGVTMNEIMPYIKRYRDKDWCETSNFFNDNPGLDVPATSRYLISTPTNPNNWQNINTATTPPTSLLTSDPYLDAANFDARFMDIPIDELENYLCFIRNNKFTSKTNICRFYYLKYDDEEIFKSEYRDKHTLAIVPVRVEMNQQGEIISTKEFIVDSTTINLTPLNTIYTVGLKECKKSPMANHNHLCPPFKDCRESTLLNAADL